MVEFLEKQLDPSPQQPQVITKGHWQGLVLRAGTHNLPLQSGPWRTMKEPCSPGPRLAAEVHVLCTGFASLYLPHPKVQVLASVPLPSMASPS